jgi:uncharacterized membrane protein
MGDKNYDTYVMFAGVYSSVDAAESDYQAVKDLYYGTDLIDTFDAAVIGKKENGKVKIYKKHEQPTRHGGWTGAGWGLATGLAVALFPAAAIGGGLLAATTATGAGIGAISGHVSAGMSRGDLKDLGSALDEGEAALIVAAASDVADKVAAAITNADDVLQKQAQIDADDLSAELDDAKSD